ncbi:TrbL/VirB6 plasmid conjugal transfer protein [Yersinia enterocolitica]|uniref:Conjugal transfer protein TrbL n=1 Tax=Proteus terrae subsp. cibarius TaxID=626774 RepID=A0ABX6JTV8_9GAMM|nr:MULTISPECIES: type IV secretion system protein [Enterobacterales]MBU5964359.1 type IV secretion system protein [Proteus mirabilis]QGW05299.1 type IV secretion system protein [Proteus terrae subsp. cibarius]QHD96427.1 conjugal transfer protein TrbL [Proteus terrae subsp. cibarius]QIF92332.1 conjugal transfer protein TrbL [Proteus terrae subsp. cibarius]QJW53097.1 conjugal transfer protein TrbL [Proteus terrae subsp. cibarius]
MDIAEGIFKSIETAINGKVVENFQIIYGIIFPIWTTGVILYYIVQAWEIIYSDKQIIVNEFVKHFMVLALVTAFLGANSVYIDNVVPAVMNSGQEIASKLVSDGSGQGGTSTGRMIDQMIEQIIEIGEREEKIAEDASWLDKAGAMILFIAKILILAIFSGAFILYATAYLIVAMVMVGILLSLGGFFIAFAAFPATRQMFTAWVGSCFNYIFLNIGYAIMFSILIQYLNQFIDANYTEEQSGLWVILLIALVFAIGVFLIQQVATLMSILTGGVGINGLTGATNAFMGKAAGALGLKAAGSALGRGMGGAGRGVANIAKSGLNALKGGGRIKP